jgi:hypothetical protein
MNTTELNSCLQQHGVVGKVALGVFAADNLPDITSLPAAFIANTDDSTKGGQHWTAFYATKDGKLEYFDSYGLKPFERLHCKYIKKNFKNKYVHNKKRLQGPMSTTCGQYALAFIYHRCLGISLKDFVGLFDKNAQHENDHLVKEIIEYYFDYSNPIFPNSKLNQICKALGH